MMEFKRREDKANAEQRAKDDAAAAKAKRQERRMCLREQKRISEILEIINDKILLAAANKEYTPDMPVYDIRDYDERQAPGICTFGGFFGELLITLSSIDQCITRNSEIAGFEFSVEQVQAFLYDLLSDANAYPQDVLSVKLVKEPLREEDKEKED